jgi:outer membrane protein TolC
MIKAYYFITSLVLASFHPLAQTQWSLKDCIDYGLKYNRNHTINLNEKKEAAAKAKDVLAGYLPAVSITGALDDNLKVQQTVIPAGIFGPEDIKVAFTKKFNSTGTIQLDQTLFDQSLLVGLKANKVNALQAQLNVQQGEEAIIYNISSAFYQIFVYREQLSFLQSNQENYRRQLEVVSLKVNKGTALQKDLDKVLVDYNNAASLIRVAESNLELIHNQLKYEMGYPIGDTIQLDSTVSDTKVYALVKEAGFKNNFAKGNLTSLRLAQVNSDLLKIDEQRIKAGIYPKLMAYARYGAVGFGNKMGESFSSLNAFSAIGLRLNIPLLDFYKRNAQYKQAKLKYLNAVEQLKLEEEKYQLQYDNARIKLVKEYSNVENNKRNVALAQSVFHTTDLQYNKGTTDLEDWLLSQNALREAQNNYLNSLYSFFTARLDLEKAGGTLRRFYSEL